MTYIYLLSHLLYCRAREIPLKMNCRIDIRSSCENPYIYIKSVFLMPAKKLLSPSNLDKVFQNFCCYTQFPNQFPCEHHKKEEDFFLCRSFRATHSHICIVRTSYTGHRYIYIWQLRKEMKKFKYFMNFQPNKLFFTNLSSLPAHQTDFENVLKKKW